MGGVGGGIGAALTDWKAFGVRKSDVGGCVGGIVDPLAGLGTILSDILYCYTDNMVRTGSHLSPFMLCLVESCRKVDNVLVYIKWVWKTRCTFVVGGACLYVCVSCVSTLAVDVSISSDSSAPPIRKFRHYPEINSLPIFVRILTAFKFIDIFIFGEELSVLQWYFIYF
jgi:hypothetical protein